MSKRGGDCAVGHPLSKNQCQLDAKEVASDTSLDHKAVRIPPNPGFSSRILRTASVRYGLQGSSPSDHSS